MMQRHQPLSFTALRPFVAMLVLFMVTFRAFIPAGFMPSMSGDAPFEMVICSLEGAITIKMDGSFDPESSSEHKPAPPCDFALNTQVLEGTDFCISLVAIHETAEHGMAVSAAPALMRFFGNASAHSPPLSVA